MQLYKIRSLNGKNIHSHKPVIKLELDLEELYDTPTNKIDNFNDRLVGMFPGLKKHCCAYGYEGGFVQRLNEGTYLAHVTEHTIIEMQNMLGYNVAFGQARILREPSVYSVVFEYKNERCGLECARAVVKIVNSLIENKEVRIEDIMASLKSVSIESELGPSTKAIFDEAVKRGIPVTRVGNESLIQIGLGKNARLACASLTDSTTCIVSDMVSNKYLTKQILSDNNIPVPEGDIAYTFEAAAAIASDIGYPVIIKPYDGNQGKGVTLDIQDEQQLAEAYNSAIILSKAVIVEKYINGRDYRLLVIGDKVSAAAERRPPYVRGDGVHNIKELVELENANSLRGEDHEKPLTKIKLDKITMHVLKLKGLDESYVPHDGEAIYLRNNGNISTGGTAAECTGIVHPYNIEMAVKAAKLLGLDIAGIDIVANDITKPIGSGNGALIEVNAAPGLRMHLYPTEGKPVNVAAEILDYLFPEGKTADIPIVSVTGTNGKTTTARLIKHMMSLMGLKVGMTSTSGVYVNDKCILKGDNTGPVSARLVLSNREAEAAVLETARGGIVKRGLGYDIADVGVITNISEDHLGLDGINSLEELAFVKSLVIEAVKPDGHSVINADDSMASYLLKRASGNIILFSVSAKNPLVQKHVQNGGRAVLVNGDAIVVSDKNMLTPVLEISDIPITFNGMAECNIQNSLAAISAAYALNIPLEIIRKGMKTFNLDVLDNPGRFNMFDMGNYKVMLDYSHNYAGYTEVFKFLRKMDAKRIVGVIGMPGDRLDRSIMETGKLCPETLSKIYIKEDIDLRGRQPGEIADILYDAVIKGGANKDDVEIIYSELEALEAAMQNAEPGDIIVMFYEEYEPAVELVTKYKEKMEAETAEESATIQEVG